MEGNAPSIIAALVCLCIGAIHLRRIVRHYNELGRFDRRPLRWWSFIARDFARLLEERASDRLSRSTSDPRVVREGLRLAEAGLKTVESRERYYLLREILIGLALVVALIAWRVCEPLIAYVVVVTVISTAFAGPRIWLWTRRQSRYESLIREMPLLLGLLHAGSVSGAELVGVLDRVADILSEDVERHAIVRELKRAQWYARMGGSWEQGLKAAQLHVSSRDEARILDGVIRVIAQEGERHFALGVLVRESLDAYRQMTEQRAAALPVQIAALLVFMALGWMCLLEIPYRIG